MKHICRDVIISTLSTTTTPPPSSHHCPNLHSSIAPCGGRKGSTPLKWANDKAAPKLAHSHAPALLCLLLVQRPADTKAITTDFDPNGILRAHTNVHAHMQIQSHTHTQPSKPIFVRTHIMHSLAPYSYFNLILTLTLKTKL